MQFQSAIVIAECHHNMDKTDARFVSVDNRMCNFSLSFDFLKAAFYCRYLVFESGAVFRLAACSCGYLACETLGALKQALLREHAGLQARDGGKDSDILCVAAAVEGECDETTNDQHKNNGCSTGKKRPPFLVDRRYHLPIRALALLRTVEPLPKLVCDLFVVQMRAYPGKQFGWSERQRQRVVGPEIQSPGPLRCAPVN